MQERRSALLVSRHIAMTLDEKALRKPGFTEGPRVKLCDGQEWTFPKPYLRLYPQRGEDGKIGFGGGFTFGPEHDERLDQFYEASEEVKFDMRLQMAVELLSQNYELDNKVLKKIFAISPDDDETSRLISDISAVLTGQSGPKASPDGSASPSSPTE